MRLLLLALVALAGCRTAPAPRPAAESLLTLQRGACFGRCPIYTVEVFADGRVRWQGERYVQQPGPAEARLAPGQLQALTARLAASGFERYAPAYEHRDWTDMAVVVLTVQGKTVRHYLGDGSAPEALTQLERDLDALVGTARWVSGEGVPR